MSFPVRLEWSTASVGSSHAPTDAVDHSAPSAIRPESTYISGKVVQTNGATSDKGYLGVSYFIVAVLWRIGLLNEAMQKARKSLPTGEQRVFGLSNILMLLNGLLNYRHSEFSPGDLDNIERFIHGLDEHPFRVPEKLAAIRAARLSAGPEGGGKD